MRALEIWEVAACEEVEKGSGNVSEFTNPVETTPWAEVGYVRNPGPIASGQPRQGRGTPSASLDVAYWQVMLELLAASFRHA